MIAVLRGPQWRTRCWWSWARAKRLRECRCTRSASPSRAPALPRSGAKAESPASSMAEVLRNHPLRCLAPKSIPSTLGPRGPCTSAARSRPFPRLSSSARLRKTAFSPRMRVPSPWSEKAQISTSKRCFLPRNSKPKCSGSQNNPPWIFIRSKDFLAHSIQGATWIRLIIEDSLKLNLLKNTSLNLQTLYPKTSVLIIPIKKSHRAKNRNCCKGTRRKKRSWLSRGKCERKWPRTGVIKGTWSLAVTCKGDLMARSRPRRLQLSRSFLVSAKLLSSSRGKILKWKNSNHQDSSS